MLDSLAPRFLWCVRVSLFDPPPTIGNSRGGVDNGLPREHREHAVHPCGFEGKTHLHSFRKVVSPFLHEAHPRGECLLLTLRSPPCMGYLVPERGFASTYFFTDTVRVSLEYLRSWLRESFYSTR